MEKGNTLLAPISVGELYDKISILEIKLDHVGATMSEKRINIENELRQLLRIRHDLKMPDSLNKRDELDGMYQELKKTNLAIWKIEDAIRQHEKTQMFDMTFVAYARQIYINNDLRAEIKKKINVFMHSDIVEEKIY